MDGSFGWWALDKNNKAKRIQLVSFWHWWYCLPIKIISIVKTAHRNSAVKADYFHNVVHDFGKKVSRWNSSRDPWRKFDNRDYRLNAKCVGRKLSVQVAFCLAKTEIKERKNVLGIPAWMQNTQPHTDYTQRKTRKFFCSFQRKSRFPYKHSSAFPFRHARTGDFLAYSTSEPVQTKLEIWAKRKKR